VKDVQSPPQSASKGTETMRKWILGIFLLNLFLGITFCCKWQMGLSFFGWNPTEAPAKYYSLSSLPDAVCLDGTAAGFYFAPATAPEGATSWVIFFEGGGWCYDEVDCWGRSKTDLGSSKGWPKDMVLGGGILSGNCGLNPTFCNFNRVFLPYCDGNSFAGNRRDPLIVKGDKIYFRGKQILDGVMEGLYSRFGLSKATEVLLSGCSAGGLATYLHANAVGDYLKKKVSSLKKYKAVPVSGFFLDQNTVENKPVYQKEIAQTFNMSNAAAGLDAKCIAFYSKSDPQSLWKCNFAQYTYPFISYPIFVLNSKYDAWQIPCIYVAEPPIPSSTANGECAAVPGWQQCSRRPDKCTSDQTIAMHNYQETFLTVIANSPTFHANGNGAFIDNAFEHCAGASNDYGSLTIGGVKMNEAVVTWWNATNDAPPGPNTYICSPAYPGKC